MSYRAPVKEMLFLLEHVLQVQKYGDLEGFEYLLSENLDQILNGAARFAETVVAPLNASGDDEACRLSPEGTVDTPRGFKAAYRQFVSDGWNSPAVSARLGGKGMPYVLSTAIEEFINSASQAFAMYADWGFYASLLMDAKNIESLRRDYLEPLVAGTWAGTMALTEPQSGTDIGMIRTVASSQADGSFRLNGTKIFISGGEHDLTDNIVHFVLARIADAPPGTAGLSLFLVPKYEAAAPGVVGARNGVWCTGLEHKMGLRASATCALRFEDARGWLIGEPNRGLKQMFVLMNHTRRACGVIAVAGSEAAYQKASVYVKERLQGHPASVPGGALSSAVALIEHPDVRRLLMRIRCFIEPARAAVLWMALQSDLLERSFDHDLKEQARQRIELLTPILKAVFSDMGFQAAVDAQQLFGGHGYIVATGIEQYVRDLRILMIAEGANGVQAMDLVTRKLFREDGRAFHNFVDDVLIAISKLPPNLVDISDPLRRSIADLKAAFESLRGMSSAMQAAAAYDFMLLLGLVMLGYMWVLILSAADAESSVDHHFQRAHRVTRAQFFMARFLCDTGVCLQRIVAETEDFLRLPVEAF